MVQSLPTACVILLIRLHSIKAGLSSLWIGCLTDYMGQGSCGQRYGEQLLSIHIKILFVIHISPLQIKRAIPRNHADGSIFFIFEMMCPL